MEKSKGLPPVRQLGAKPGTRAKPKERDFAPPPPTPVEWVVVDSLDPTNTRKAVAQTAFRAHELSGIMRNGQRLAYGECVVFYAEVVEQAAALITFLEKVSAPRAVTKKSNGKANGHV